MAEPIFWLGFSLLLVAVSLTAVLVVALPVLQELGRAARSAEKLFDTLARELPPTLESIRLTGLEISDLTDDISESVQSAGDVVKQVDRSFSHVKRQAQQVNLNTKGLVVGVKAAWRSLTNPQPLRLKSGESQRSNHRRYEMTQSGEPRSIAKPTPFSPAESSLPENLSTDAPDTTAMAEE